MDQILSLAISDGIFAVLFVWLFFYQIKDSQKREKNYQKIIDNLSEHLKTIAEVKADVVELKDIVKKRNGKGEKVFKESAEKV